MQITIRKVYVDGVLIPLNTAEELKENAFLKTLKENDVVEETYELVTEDKSYAQLSKIHLCIRSIAEETGDTFDSIKTQIKERAGLYTQDGKPKSFKHCFKEELNRAIQTAIEVGEFLNLNLY